MTTSAYKKMSWFVVIVSICMVSSVTVMAGDVGSKNEITIDYRAGRLSMFPCSKCHQHIKESTGAWKHAHDDIKIKHGVLNKNCSQCHSGHDKMNELFLAETQSNVPFEMSYKVCGQCHGTILRDWNQGIHGLQTGMWNGPKLRRTCTECHDPHNPKFKAIHPSPAPVLPRGKVKKGH